MRQRENLLKSLQKLLSIPSKLKLIQNLKVTSRNTAKKSTIVRISQRVGKKTKAISKKKKMRKIVFGQKRFRKKDMNFWIHQKQIVNKSTTQKKTPMIKVKIVSKLSMVRRGLSC